MNDISHIADILAIPFFFLLTVYFYQLPDKNILECVLFLFALTGLLLDVLFTYMYMCKLYNFQIR